MQANNSGNKTLVRATFKNSNVSLHSVHDIHCQNTMTKIRATDVPLLTAHAKRSTLSIITCKCKHNSERSEVSTPGSQ